MTKCDNVVDILMYSDLMLVFALCLIINCLEGVHANVTKREIMPYIRNHLARAVMNRMLEDQQQANTDHPYWYEVEESDLPEDIASLFEKLSEDNETKQFLDNCYDKADWLFTQMYYGVASSILRLFLTQTSANGFLGRGSMFVYSEDQFLQILEQNHDWKSQKLLDLGAGDGEVTKMMSGHFEETHCTELSTPMTWRLNQKGYKIVGINEWHDGTEQYDVISCLNVLDRCDKPYTLLQDIKSSLRPRTGRAVVAMVLPYSPYVEFNKRDHTPDERLPVEGRSFEDQATSLIENFFRPSGFTVEKFTRVPYLCEGDLQHSFYVLDDVVYVLSVPET